MDMEGSPIDKKEFAPEINEKTGLSYDYVDAYGPLITLYTYGGIADVKKYILEKKFRMMRYDDFMRHLTKEKEGFDIVNEKNRLAVNTINGLVDAFNNSTGYGDAQKLFSFNEDDFLRICSEIQSLIQGEKVVFEKRKK